MWRQPCNPVQGRCRIMNTICACGGCPAAANAMCANAPGRGSYEQAREQLHGPSANRTPSQL
eukprot:9476374-Pyramimonas_sp.AAC.1